MQNPYYVSTRLGATAEAADVLRPRVQQAVVERRGGVGEEPGESAGGGVARAQGRGEMRVLMAHHDAPPPHFRGTGFTNPLRESIVGGVDPPTHRAIAPHKKSRRRKYGENGSVWVHALTPKLVPPGQGIAVKSSKIGQKTRWRLIRPSMDGGGVETGVSSALLQPNNMVDGHQCEIAPFVRLSW